MKGLKDRIYTELCTLLPEAMTPHVTIMTPDSHNTAWLGSSIVTSVCHFQFWMSHEEYNVYGPEGHKRKNWF
jgi:actin-related protein